MNILITGAGHGIGYASAIALAKLGHHITASDINEAGLLELRNVAKAESLRIDCITLDIINADDREIINDIKPDILIANAAIGESGPMVEIPLERLRHVIETNVVSTIATCQLAAKHMISRAGQHGESKPSGAQQRIIIVGSTAGLVTLPFLGPYNMTKFALEAGADALRMELKQFGIRVSLIEPGKIDTGFNQKMTATKFEWLDEKSAYAEKIETMRQTDAEFFSNEYNVAVVVRGIVHAVTANTPKSRYVTPPSTGWTIRLTRLLPDSWRDAILSRLLHL